MLLVLLEFSRSWGKFSVFASNCDWPFDYFTYFVFVFRHSNENHLISRYSYRVKNIYNDTVIVKL